MKMNTIPFFKMSGAGNDFIVIDNTNNIVDRTKSGFPDFVKHICNRRISAGADGGLLVEKATDADFAMHYFNADGSRAAMCGNGARCISSSRI